MANLEVKVDWDLCDSYGVCVAAAPKVFDLNDEDDLVVLRDRPEEDQLAAVRDAAMRCPKRAIRLVEVS